MKLTSLKNLLLVGSLVAFGSLSASAAILDCNSETTLDALQKMSQNGDSCMIGGVLGSTDKIFSDFSFHFDSGRTNDTAVQPELPSAADVAADFSLSSGTYTLEFDFSPANATTSPAAVAADQTMDFFITYEVTVTDPSQFVNLQGGQTVAGLLSLDGSEDAFASSTIQGCQSGAFTGSPQSAVCPSGGDVALNNAMWTSSVGSDTDTAATDPDNQDPRSGTASPLNSTTFGVLDEASLNGGDIDTSTTNAALFSMTNTLTQGTNPNPGTPEPATFILLGGALVGLGAYRRSKKTA